MNSEEINKVIKVIEANYPNFVVDEELYRVKIKTWASNLKLMEYEKVMKRLNEHLMNNPYPPTLADIAVKSNSSNKAFEDIENLEKQAERRSNGKVYMSPFIKNILKQVRSNAD